MKKFVAQCKKPCEYCGEVLELADHESHHKKCEKAPELPKLKPHQVELKKCIVAHYTNECIYPEDRPLQNR